MKNYLIGLTVLLGFFSYAHAQYIDSLNYISSVEGKSPKQIISDNTRIEFRKKNLYFPSLLLLGGVLLSGKGEGAIKNKIVHVRNQYLFNASTDVDDYLQFSPIALSYGLDAFGVKSKTEFTNRSIILLKSELIALGAARFLKKVSAQARPDANTYNSFPSGHTTQAFVAAAFLSEEYKDRFRWMPYVSYGMASSVGVLRMTNNRHYISDVLFAAGLGILSVKISYWTHQYKWGRRENYK